MSKEQKPIRIIPREAAVFRLDKNGVWFLKDEKFSNKKIINYFHSIIKKDEDGYFLEQEHKHYIEKVYFPYEDTALFVFQILKTDEGLDLRLNTGKRMVLDPEKLIMKNDNLYVRDDEELIKIHPDALLSLADYVDEAEGKYVINMGGKSHPIPRME